MYTDIKLKIVWTCQLLSLGVEELKNEGDFAQPLTLKENTKHLSWVILNCISHNHIV